MSFDDWGARGGGGGYSSQPRGYQAPVRDGDSEYVRLSQQVTSNIFAINQNVAQLQKMVGYLGTQRDVHEMRDKMHDIQEQTRRLIRDANGAIKQLGEFDGGSQSETRERKMQQEKLSKDFKTVLQKFQTCYQVAISKERENVIQQRERAASFRDERSHYEPGGGHDERTSLIEDEQRRQVAQLDAQIDYSSSLIQEREEGIKEIEATMLEVNEIYRDLSTLVVEQGTQLDNIEANMSSVDHAVESGAQQLGKASHYQKKARNKMCCILVVVTIVAAILVIVLVIKLH